MSKKTRRSTKKTTKKKPETMYDSWIQATIGESNGNIAMKEGNYYFNHYFNWLCEIALQLFEYENLPKGLPFYEIERNLIYNGATALYYDKDFKKLLALNGTYTDINLYNEPIRFQAANPRYKNHSFPLYVEFKDIPDAGVLIRNNFEYRPLVTELRNYATQLAQIRQVIEMNLNSHKHPIAIEASDYNLLSLQKMFDSYEQNSPVIFTKKDAGGGDGGLLKDMKVLNLNAPYIVDKLQIQFKEVWNEAMNRMGLNSLSVFKKERVNTDDSNANNEQFLATRNSLLMFREYGIARANDYFNLDMKVFPRKFIVENEYGEKFVNGGEKDAV